MSIAEINWTIYALIGCLYGVWLAIGAFLVCTRVRRLDEFAPPEPHVWPALSVLVPARNEADTIAAAAATLSAQDYPNLEIVLIDDRSDDATGAIIDQIALTNPRVRAIHMEELPSGWLGKVYALSRGASAAHGEWLLLTDADVHFSPGVLRRVIAWSVHRELDHLAAAPEIWPANFYMDAAVSAFLRSFCVGMRIWAVEDADSGAYIGVGAFNLVRRAAWERTEGFEWLKLEVADDLGVGLLMKQSGARCAAVNAVGQIGLCWYPSLGKMLVGAEKAFASLAGCSVGRMLMFGAVGILLDAAPWLTLAAAIWFRSPWLLAAAGLMILAHVASTVMLSRWADRQVLPGLLNVILLPFAVVAFVRTAWLGWRRGGVAWRGTVYPSRILRAGKRVWLGASAQRCRPAD